MNRIKARAETFKQVGEILATWRGRASPAQKAQKAKTDNADGNQTKPQAKLMSMLARLLLGPASGRNANQNADVP